MSDFSLKAVFGMDATGVRAELKTLRREFGSFVEDYAKLGAGLAVAAFTALSKGAIDLAGSLADASANLGINVVSLQALEQQHARNGVSSNDLTKALEKTKAAILDSSGGNVLAKRSLDALGLSVDRLLKLPLDQQYEAIAKAAAKSKNESAAYAAVCDLLGEKVGPKLMGSLRELGEQGLPEITRAAREAGHVMESETIVALDRAGDAIDDFKKRATIAVGNILVNFNSTEGLKLLGLQFLKVLSQFGGGIVDAIKEANDFLGAVFKGTFSGLINLFRDGLINAAESVASALNKILPERFEINVGNLEQFKSSGKSLADEITDAIARTQPSTFKREAGQFWDAAIAQQKKVVDALNEVDFGDDAKKIEDAGIAAGKSIADGAKKIPAEIPVVVPPKAAEILRSFAGGMHALVNRGGASYDQQSSASLEGVRQRLQSRLTQMENEYAMSTGGVGGKARPAEFYLLQSELHNLMKEINLRNEAARYAQRYGEDAARGQFGDSVTNRAIQDLSKDSTRTANTLDQINRRLGSLLDD